MLITQHDANKFAFGQIETRKDGRPYVLRGDIEIIVVNNRVLDITCLWVAKKDLKGPSTHKWRICNTTHFSFVVDQYDYHDAYLGARKFAWLTHGDKYEEEVFLYLPDGDRLCLLYTSRCV